MPRNVHVITASLSGSRITAPRSDGLLDTFREQVRFGFSTFDSTTGQRGDHGTGDYSYTSSSGGRMNAEPAPVTTGTTPSVELIGSHAIEVSHHDHWPF